MVRTPSYDKNGIRKGTWTKEEDEKLRAYVTKYGSWNWNLIPKFAGLSRCGKSCRLRWMNYLRSDIKRGNFEREEDETILQLHKTLGNRWSAIAAHLPGRTDNEIKNRWHTILKKLSDHQKPSNSQVEAATTSSNPLCSQLNIPEEEEEEEELDQTPLVLNSEMPITEFAANKGTNFGADGEGSAFGFSTEHSMELGGNLWTDPIIFEDTLSCNNPTHVSMDLYEDYQKSPSLFDEFFLWP